MIPRGLKIAIMLLATTSLGCWSTTCCAALIAPVTYVLQPCSTGQALLQPAEPVMADEAWDLKDYSSSHDPSPLPPRSERLAWFVPSGTTGDMGGTSGSVVSQSVAAIAWLPLADLWNADNQPATLIMKSSKLPDRQLGGRLFRPPRWSRSRDR